MKPTMSKNSAPPASVTILAVLVLLLTFWYAIRIYSTIVNWQVLIEFEAIPAYILGTGIFWALVGAGLFIIFWRGITYAAPVGTAAAAGHFLWYWFDRLVMQLSPAPNEMFSLIVSTLFMAAFIIVLNIPASRSFFNKE
jgi:hypothetical protein